MENTKKYSAAVFDTFAYRCPYFDVKTNVNNGYGCSHPNNDEKREDESGKMIAPCYCCNCPLGMSADDESLDNPDIDWDGDKPEPGDVEDEYLIIRTDEQSSDDEKNAWDNYQRYINRYNK